MGMPSFEPYTLRDGRTIAVRPLRPDDAPRLQALVQRLSPESRFFRFMEYVKELSPAQAAIFTDLDYHQRMALAAVLSEDGEEYILGVARYAVQPGIDLGRAEVGVVVEDAYQSMGIGSYLLALLTQYARQHGIHTFIGAIYPTNERILKFIQQSGLEYQRRYVDGAWEVSIFLTDAPERPGSPPD